MKGRLDYDEIQARRADSLNKKHKTGGLQNASNTPLVAPSKMPSSSLRLQVLFILFLLILLGGTIIVYCVYKDHDAPNRVMEYAVTKIAAPLKQFLDDLIQRTIKTNADADSSNDEL